MNIFEYRDDLLTDYSEYVRSFIRLRNPRIQAFVEDALEKEVLWPDPLIQLNPTFKPGAPIDDLCTEGLLHPECKAIFRRNKTPDSTGGGDTLRLHQHQEDAIRVAAQSRNYVLTTGTGSGKSLAYIVPIVDRVLREGPGKGIRAIIIYPMNALANSQFGELEKFLHHGFPEGKGPVTFQRYTGQEDDETRQKIITSPPDILLTNYVMLELILTRPYERKLIGAGRDLQFLVLDELHTYRGRQGADVALLLRRVRSILRSKTLQCVGTSATLSSRGKWSDQQAEVARLATRLFGMPVEPADIIGETLERATDEFADANREHVNSLRHAIQSSASRPVPDFDALSHDPLARWVESTFGMRPEQGTGRLIRTRPLPLTGPTGAALRLSSLTGIDEETCRAAVASILLAGATRIQHPRTGFPVFPFRLHQFVSRGDTLYATAEDPETRYLTLRGQLYSPEDRAKILLPLCFCRECGQEYYSVSKARDDKTGVERFAPREAHNRTALPGHELGFLHICTDKPWPRQRGSAEELSRLPPDWIEEDDGTRRIIKSRRDRVPIPLCVESDGRVGAVGIEAAFIPAPFLFCLNCGVTHNARQRSDFPKLGTLGSEGRSTATTVLTTTAIARLHREATIPADARKLLSFTDTDASGGTLQQRVRWWSALLLLRAMASSPTAAAATLRERSRTLEAADALTADEIGRKAVMDASEDSGEESSDEAPGADAEAAEGENPNRRRLLAFAREADKLRGDADAKLIDIVRHLKGLLKDGFKPIVFCRFIETAEYLAEELRTRLGTKIAVACVTSRLAPEERGARIETIGGDGDQARVLVCTDCLSEGINLQAKFDAVVHYDLSWNPTRHEQREGRVDRFGQPSPEVRVLTYYGVDNRIDGIVLDILLRKHNRIRSALGISVPTPST